MSDVTVHDVVCRRSVDRAHRTDAATRGCTRASSTPSARQIVVRRAGARERAAHRPARRALRRLPVRRRARPIRVLESMGLVESRRRRRRHRPAPSTSWNVFDPRVIRWRLDGPDREGQLLSPEPAAARRRAGRGRAGRGHATPEQCGALTGAVMQMVGARPRPATSRPTWRPTRLFHRTLLAGLRQRDARRPRPTWSAEVLAGPHPPRPDAGHAQPRGHPPAR